MKIFFFDTCRDGTVGGSHTCMYNLIRKAADPEIRFTVGFYEDNIFAKRFRDMGTEVHILPIREPSTGGPALIRKARNLYRLEIKGGLQLLNFLRKGRFDLIVMNNSVYASLQFIRIARLLGIPTVVYERGFAVYRDRDRRAIKQISVSVPISDTIRDNMESQGLRPPVMRRLYDGIDPGDFSESTDRAGKKSALDIPPESRVIGIVGNIRPWKGQATFVDAFLRLAQEQKDLYGLMIGSWGAEDGEFQAGLVKKITDAGLEDRLLFLGFRDDVPELLAMLDVFVHASVKPEPFGIVILEAMSIGVPIVATNIGGPVEILESGQCGLLVPEGDSEALADACRRYLSEPKLAEEMAELSKKRLKENFHLDRTVQETMDLYRSVTSG